MALHFEIMELYDKGRPRHDEYKKRFRKARAAQNWADISEVETWDQVPVSLQEILVVAEERLQSKEGNYSADTKMGLDDIRYSHPARHRIDPRLIDRQIEYLVV